MTPWSRGSGPGSSVCSDQANPTKFAKFVGHKSRWRPARPSSAPRSIPRVNILCQWGLRGASRMVNRAQPGAVMSDSSHCAARLLHTILKAYQRRDLQIRWVLLKTGRKSTVVFRHITADTEMPRRYQPLINQEGVPFDLCSKSRPSGKSRK